MAMLHAAESGAAIMVSAQVRRIKRGDCKQAQARSFNRHLISVTASHMGIRFRAESYGLRWFCHAQGLPWEIGRARPVRCYCPDRCSQ